MAGKSAEVLTLVRPGSAVEAGGTGAPASDVERALCALLADLVGVDTVPVDGHFFDDLGADSMVLARFCARVRKRPDLPPVSMKDVYRHSTVRTLAAALDGAGAPPAEGALAQVLADVLGVERVPVDGHFFDDLGADSMVMAGFCARIRKRPDLPPVSMKDVYRHSTVRDLARALDGGASAPVEAQAPAPVEPPYRASTAQYLCCGLLQLLFFLAVSTLSSVIMVRGYEWVVAAPGVLGVYLRSVLFGGGLFVVLCILPIIAKWVLIGRWRPRQIRVWSLGYLRFWVVKTLIRANPLALFAGSPLYVLYLRALGARVGRGVAIFSRSLPVCTDLLTIGDGTVVRKDSVLSCYRAHAGMIQTGRVTLGRDVVVGEVTVLDIDTSIGDGGQLGHASSLHAGQAVPAGERWHGSPAQRTDTDYRTVEPARCGAWRKVSYSVLQLVGVLVYAPAFFAVLVLSSREFEKVVALLAADHVALTGWVFYVDAVLFSAVLFSGSVVLGLLIVYTVPRLLNRALVPGRVYRLYGFHYWAHKWISGITNRKFFMVLFGDSSYVVGHLRRLGYDLARAENTGSNFGTVVKHDNPFLSSVASGTMAADGLSFINADFSSTSFRVSPVVIGARSFLGNAIAYPSQGRTGENCLIGTKAMVPIDGPIRENTGLLGSPSFEIPRTVERDTRFDHLKGGDEHRRLLAAKNRYNRRTMAWFLLSRWIHVLGLTVIGAAAVDVYHLIGVLAFALFTVVGLVFTFGYYVLIERGVVLRFRRLRPQICSIYDPYFWWHERFWKLVLPPILKQILFGTPFKNVVSRMLGMHVGRRVFDDGAAFSEHTLVAIGDDCTLNSGSGVQSHSQEDGTFKSDRSTVGAGCTLGVNAFVHYGVTIGDGAVIAPDSFLMKGEEVPASARWGGNPAREMRNGTPVAATPPPRRSRRHLGVAAALVPVAAVAAVAAFPASQSPLPTNESPAPVAAPHHAPAPQAAALQPTSAPAADVAAAPAPAPVPAPPPPAAAVPAGPVELGHGGYFGLTDVPRLDAGLLPGDLGTEVANSQFQLQRIGYYAGPVHGRLDEATADAVRRFQLDARVLGDPGGTIGRATALALLAAGERPLLAVGDSSEDVHRLQHALMVALERKLPMSGSFGPETREAVREYQRSRGLPASGEVDIRTWMALEGGR